MSKIEHIKRHNVEIFLAHDIFTIDHPTLADQNIKQEYNRAHSDKRKAELRALDYIWSQHFKNTNFNRKETGKPICDDYHLSISHHDGYLALSKSLSPVGVDIEGKRKQLNTIQHKFLHDEEKKWISQLEDLQKIWSVKEVVYKIFDDDQLFFARDMNVMPITNNEKIIHAEVQHKNKLHSMDFECIKLKNEIILVTNIS